MNHEDAIRAIVASEKLKTETKVTALHLLMEEFGKGCIENFGRARAIADESEGGRNG